MQLIIRILVQIYIPEVDSIYTQIILYGYVILYTSGNGLHAWSGFPATKTVRVQISSMRTFNW